jgi:hypothetical protein
MLHGRAERTVLGTKSILVSDVDPRKMDDAAKCSFHAVLDPRVCEACRGGDFGKHILADALADEERIEA